MSIPLPDIYPTTSVILPYEDFANDEANKLGRANGNTYQRKPGIENIHDGQIMVRLKKKRFIILDYSYIPSEEDYHIAKSIHTVTIPTGAGRQQCATKDCHRVGVPVLLYDSEPNEPASLYLRGGLCFSCQRHLNEKRRTQRKRKTDEHRETEEHFAHEENDRKNAPALNRVKANGEYIELNSDAIIINGPVEGTRTRGPGYQFGEIGSDVLHIISELNQESNALMAHSTAHSSNIQSGMAHAVVSTASINSIYEKTFLSLSKATFLLTQWKASWDEALASNIAMASAAEAAANASLDSQALDQAVAAAAALASATQEGGMSGSETMDQMLMEPVASSGHESGDIDDALVEV